MDGGAYILGDLLAVVGRRPGDVLEVTMEGERLTLCARRPEVAREPLSVQQA